jgi:hypothetical protein
MAVDAPRAALLSELDLSASPAGMAFSDRAAGYRRLCGRADWSRVPDESPVQ